MGATHTFPLETDCGAVRFERMQDTRPRSARSNAMSHRWPASLTLRITSLLTPYWTVMPTRSAPVTNGRVNRMPALLAGLAALQPSSSRAILYGIFSFLDLLFPSQALDQPHVDR
jgi:hypothetical protein